MSDRFDVAGSHLARMVVGRDTAAAVQELDAWRDAAPENREAADQVLRLWDGAGGAGDDADIQNMLADMRSRYEPSDNAHHSQWKGWAIAAGLALTLSVPAAYWLMQRTEPSPVFAQKTQEATPGDLRIVAGPSGRRTVGLDDGSQITLDVGSAVRVAFSADRRGVTLEAGRAHFQVHKDARRPFVVTAGRLTATAVGTAFDVSLSREGEEVLTSEGIVRVRTLHPVHAQERDTLLKAGMKLTQTANSAMVASVDATQEIAWTDGKIIASSRCLGDIARQMNRYGASPLVIRPDAAMIAISGVFDLDNGSGLAEALEQQGLANVRREGGRIVLSRASAATTDCK